MGTAVYGINRCTCYPEKSEKDTTVAEAESEIKKENKWLWKENARLNRIIYRLLNQKNNGKDTNGYS